MNQRILIAAGSRYGATFEIAAHIGHCLRQRDIDVSVEATSDVDSVAGYAGIVLGSAVYAGKWLPDATRFAERLIAMEPSPMVWLFSSGLNGDPADPEQAAEGLGRLVEMTAARDLRLFTGKLDKSKLNLAERAMMMAVRAPDGDYRDWDQITDWAETIAADMKPSPADGDGVSLGLYRRSS